MKKLCSTDMETVTGGFVMTQIGDWDQSSAEGHFDQKTGQFTITSVNGRGRVGGAGGTYCGPCGCHPVWPCP